MADQRLLSDRFPRSSPYHSEWLLAGVSGGANPLWLTEWLAEALALRPRMRALEADAGRHPGYVRAVGRRRADAQMFDPSLSVPVQYTKKPLLRGTALTHR